MDTVILSPKFQVVIPRRVRERIGLRPGEKLQVISFDDRIELIPIRPMSEMKGFLKGLDPTFKRDKGDRVLLRRRKCFLLCQTHRRHRTSDRSSGLPVRGIQEGAPSS
jgi:AbrB family looped-hinge helix DNA binding protein